MTYKRKPLVVVMDEFQAILEIPDSAEVIAELRAQILRASDVPFIFAESIRHQMEEIFFISSSSLFFKLAISLELAPLPYIELAPFLLQRFREENRDISENIPQSIFDLAGGITGDVQQFCEALWSKTDILVTTLYRSTSRQLSTCLFHEKIYPFRSYWHG